MVFTDMKTTIGELKRVIREAAMGRPTLKVDVVAARLGWREGSVSNVDLANFVYEQWTPITGTHDSHAPVVPDEEAFPPEVWAIVDRFSVDEGDRAGFLDAWDMLQHSLDDDDEDLTSGGEHDAEL